MTEYEYAQAVMKAAGVEPTGKYLPHFGELGKACAKCALPWSDGMWSYPCFENPAYPDPLTSGDAFLALWDALVAKGYVVRITVYPTRMTCVRMFSHAKDTFTAGEADDADRRVALVEAAGRALGVTR